MSKNERNEIGAETEESKDCVVTLVPPKALGEIEKQPRKQEG